ncbi:MAG: outer membrane protein [Pseudomonadota bacterium]
MKSMTAITVLSLATATATLAVLPAQAQDGTGRFYVGPTLGYTNFKGRVTEGDFGISANDDKMSPGVLAGMEFGMRQPGAMLLGVESDLQKLGFDGGDYSFGLSGRAGFAVDEKITAFAKGGYSRLLLNNNAPDFDGWHAGAGLDFALNQNWLLRAEYRYTNYEKRRIVPMEAGFTTEGEFSSHQATAGLLFRF